MDPKRAKAQIVTPSGFDISIQAQGFNGAEGHGVDSESDGVSEPNDGDDSEEGFPGIEALKREYYNKKDIIDSVADYHARVMRPYKVSKSDKRRYKVICPVVGCDFLAQFAFTSSFGRVPKLVPHSCEADYSNQLKKRFSTAKYLVRSVKLREYFLQFDQKNITPVMIQRKANKLGLHALYMNCVNAFKHLMRDFYGDGYSQYPFIPSYIDALEKNGHKACCEIDAGTFSRLAIVYREGIQAFSQYADRGLSIDGTFLKTLVGGTLLVACFRNGNMELQIVGVAIVSIENQANWDFFLRFLMTNIGARPHFLISDRDKGLVPAVASLNPIPNHFFCFRHLMENFNRKFKSKSLKNAAWELARALNETQFVKQATVLSGMNSSAAAWLMDVGKEKWSLCYSPCPRFGSLTSNNVESINGALRKIRKLPVLDCLIAIERYIGEKWVSNSANAVNWGLLTHRAAARMKRLLSITPSIEVSQHSESSFVVTEYTKCGVAPIEYIVQLFETSATCSCGFTADMGGPCTHTLVCLSKAGMLNEVHRFFDASWKTHVYCAAYKQDDPHMLSPPTVKDSLIAGECTAPKIIKRRGRPKKKNRRESQGATLLLTKRGRKKQR